MKPLLLILALLLVLGSVADIDAGKRKHRKHRAEEPRYAISIDGGPPIEDTHGVTAAAGSYANPMHFTAAEVPVYLYVDDAVFARQVAAYRDLSAQVDTSKYPRLPRFTLYQLPQRSCEEVDAGRGSKPVQSISVCQRDEFGWWGYVTMWYSQWPDELGRVMMQLRTDKAHSLQGLHCHEMMHAISGALDDYGADPNGSCIYGDLDTLGAADVWHLKSLYPQRPEQTVRGVRVNPRDSRDVEHPKDKHKKRKKRR